MSSGVQELRTIIQEGIRVQHGGALQSGVCVRQTWRTDGSPRALVGLYQARSREQLVRVRPVALEFDPLTVPKSYIIPPQASSLL